MANIGTGGAVSVFSSVADSKSPYCFAVCLTSCNPSSVS